MDVFTTALLGKVIVYPCHLGGGNQFFAFEKSGLIISAEELCLGINNNKSVILVKCKQEDKLQYWDFNKNVCTLQILCNCFLFENVFFFLLFLRSNGLSTERVVFVCKAIKVM